jgi:hypothetical protein
MQHPRSTGSRGRGQGSSAPGTTSPLPKLWFTPYANLIVSTSGNLTSGNPVVTDGSFSMLQVGAGLTWR